MEGGGTRGMGGEDQGDGIGRREGRGEKT